MGKPDKQVQPKLTFEFKRLKKAALQVMSDTETDVEAAGTSKLERIMVAMQQSLQTIYGKIDTLNLRMDNMASKLDKHAARLTEAEQRISNSEDKVEVITKSCAQIEKLFAVINTKNEDLEARSWRNNLRILGSPQI